MPEETGLQTIEEQIESYPGVKNQKGLAQKVSGWFQEAKDGRSTRDPKLLEQYKIFRFYGRQAKFPWRSDIYIPMGHVNVLVNTAKMVTAILGSDPFFRTTARSLRFAQSEEFVEQLMYEQLDEMGWSRVLHDWALDHYIFGLGILKGFWKFEEVEEETEVTKFRPVFIKAGDQLIESEPEPYTEIETTRRVVFDGPAFEVVNIFDFYPDPHATSIKDARYVIHRREVSIDHLRSMAAKGVYSEEAVNIIAAQRMEGRSDNSEKVSIDDIEDNLIANETKAPIQILECWTPTRKIVVGPSDVLLNPSTKDNPERDKNPFPRIPFFDLPHLPTGHKLFGIGTNEPVTTIQKGINKIHNLHLDNLNIQVHKMFLVSEDAVRNPGDIVARPGGYIRVKAGRDLDSAVKELSKQPLPMESQIEMDTLERMNETATGVNEPAKGIERRSGKGETATKTRISAAGASVRFGVELILVEPKIQEVLEFMHSLNQLFFDFPRELTGGGTVGPENVEPDFKFKMELSPIQGDERVQRLIMVSQQSGQNPQTALRTNWSEFQRRLADAADIRNPNALFGDQFIEQNVQVMMMGQPPQGGTPGGGENGPATNPQVGAANAQRRAPQPTAADARRDIFSQVG